MLALLSLLMLPQLGIIYIEDAATSLLWRKTFNSSEGGSDCTEHGADSTDASHDCSTSDNPQEGDGRFLFSAGGSGTTTTLWADDWTGIAVTWVQLHVAIWDLAFGGGTRILHFVNGAGGDVIGTTGYSINYVNPNDNIIAIFCDDDSVTWNFAFTTLAWHTWDIMIDTDNGDIDVYVDGAGSPTQSCDGTGGDSATPFDGLAVNGDEDELWLGLDDIRIYNTDPR